MLIVKREMAPLRGFKTLQKNTVWTASNSTFVAPRSTWHFPETGSSQPGSCEEATSPFRGLHLINLDPRTAVVKSLLCLDWLSVWGE